MTIETFCKEICKGDFVGKESMLNALTEYKQKIRADVIDELLDISWHSIDLKDFRREVMKLKEQNND